MLHESEKLKFACGHKDSINFLESRFNCFCNICTRELFIFVMFKIIKLEKSMPYKSKAQRAWMHANKPAMAKKWDKETPKGKKLPEKVKKKKSK